MAGGNPAGIVVKRWSGMDRDEVFEMMALRSEVFFVEQRIDEPDFDAADRDESTVHMWIRDVEGIAAYLRVTRLAPPERGARTTFGRVAVRANRRRGGLARALIREVLQECGQEPLVIHAQEYVVGLYEDYGFKVVGERFTEAGLAHRTMIRAGA